MKFAHMSDVHLGSWAEEGLRELSLESFKKAIDMCMKEKVDLILIAGDLFNTSLPSIDVLKETANILNNVRKQGINIYCIPGSHDYSASGKTMIDVLENSGLLINVARLDGGKLRMYKDKDMLIAGWHGRRGGLEKNEYSGIEMDELEKIPGYKIFMFHTMLEEFKPKDLDIVECMSVNLLPKGFNYYAGGHPHYVLHGDYGVGKLTYPGALFPNNFKELERFKHGGFYIIDGREGIKWVGIKTKDVESYEINADGKSPKEVESDIINKAENIKDKIVTLRISGCLKEGKPSDIDYKRIDEAFSSCYHLLKNTSKLTSEEVEQIEVREGSVEEIENSIAREFSKDNGDSLDLVNSFMVCLDKEKEDGETNNDFSLRVVKDSIKTLKMEEVYDSKEYQT